MEKNPNGLVLRSIQNEDDIQRFVTFNTRFNNPFEGATCECLTRHRPGSVFDNYWIVEDERSGEIVSTSCLLPWKCKYAGIELDVAMLEMVLTHPDYRGRGLVRWQMEYYHQIVEKKGFDLCIIWGIPFYYRQFGYGYALDGNRYEVLSTSQVASLKTSKKNLVIPVTPNDIPLLMQFYNRACSVLDFYVNRTEQYWKYLIENARHPMWLFSYQNGVRFGYVILRQTTECTEILESSFANQEDAFSGLESLTKKIKGEVHIYGHACDLLASTARSLGSWSQMTEQWYLRIPDESKFLHNIKPVIENRVEKSQYRGISTDLIINLYRKAVRLTFKSGELVSVDSLGFIDSSMGKDGGDCLIPPDAFLRLVFGYRTIDQLQDAWPDLIYKPDKKFLLEILFPQMKSHIYMPFHYLGEM